jgi:hypothetical protein
MNAVARILIMSWLVVPAWAHAQTTRDASRIAGSIFPTVIKPASFTTPRPSVVERAPAVAPGTQGMAVCLSAQDDAEQCRANVTASTHAATIAFCDVAAVGLSHCLSRYANALVKRPVAASRTLSLVVRDAQGSLHTAIVLASAMQSDQDIANAALDGTPGGSIVAVQVPQMAGANLMQPAQQ